MIAYPRRVRLALVAAALLSMLVGGAPAAPVATLRADGIGDVHFGLPKNRAVAELSALFGTPTARGINSGCGPRYTEVDWGDFAAEFRSGSFSGYRYLVGGYAFSLRGAPRPTPKAVVPRLATATGVSLGSMLAELRAAYRSLSFVGTDRWRSTNGLVFTDDAEHDPEPPASRIVEIKIGTCGDF
jgi:hypothetical protein